jgi:GT2 family glycosyltransferase
MVNMGIWPRVLIGVPTFGGMKYCLDEFLVGLRNLTYPNAEILMVDNSLNDNFFEELKKERDIVVVRDETLAKKPAERLVSSRNKILDYAVEKGFDYVFMLDADVVCPRGIIEELMKCRKEVISGLYFGYFNSSGKLKILSVAWRGITPEEFAVIRSKVKLSESVKSHEDLQRHLTQEEIDSNSLLEVIYPSAGCMLLSRAVFSMVRYGLPETPEGFTASGDDIYFIREARKLGFGIWCHTGFKCDHLLDGKYTKDSQGRLIHPLNPDYYRLC